MLRAIALGLVALLWVRLAYLAMTTPTSSRPLERISATADGKKISCHGRLLVDRDTVWRECTGGTHFALARLDFARGTGSPTVALEGSSIAAVTRVDEDLLVFPQRSRTAYRVSPRGEATAIAGVPEDVGGVGVRGSVVEVVASGPRTGEIMTISPEGASSTRTYPLPVAPRGSKATLVHAELDDGGWTLGFALLPADAADPLTEIELVIGREGAGWNRLPGRLPEAMVARWRARPYVAPQFDGTRAGLMLPQYEESMPPRLDADGTVRDLFAPLERPASTLVRYDYVDYIVNDDGLEPIAVIPTPFGAIVGRTDGWLDLDLRAAMKLPEVREVLPLSDGTYWTIADDGYAHVDATLSRTDPIGAFARLGALVGRHPWRLAPPLFGVPLLFVILGRVRRRAGLARGVTTALSGAIIMMAITIGPGVWALLAEF